MQIIQNRRDFLASLSLAGAAGMLGARGSLADEGPPETTTIRLAFTTAICFAPFDVAEAFLRAEGFTDVQYVKAAGGFSSPQMVASGDLDFGVSFAGTIVYHLDAGLPITAVSGLHAGCYELFAREPIRSISDLKGRRVGIQTLSNSGHLYVSIMAKHVGLDPNEDIEWVVPADGNAMELFAERRDRRLPRLSARAAGAARPRLQPRDPEHAHRPAVVAVFLLHDLRQPRLGPRSSGRDQAFPARDLQGRRVLPGRARERRAPSGRWRVREALRLRPRDDPGAPYEFWHEYDPEDSLRFYALRLHEAGMINRARTRSSPRAPTGASSTSSSAS